MKYGFQIQYELEQFCDFLPIEKIHHKMLKSILGVNKQASNLACRLKCNREPLSLFELSQIYKYYYTNLKVKNQ